MAPGIEAFRHVIAKLKVVPNAFASVVKETWSVSYFFAALKMHAVPNQCFGTRLNGRQSIARHE